MEDNLELNKQITFDDLVQHGRDNGANIVNGMPWHWKINGKAITHENDKCYIIETVGGSLHFHTNDFLVATEEGLKIIRN